MRRASVATVLVLAITAVTALAAGARITAHLSKTSFTTSQARAVTLTYRFSKTSRHFTYVISIAKGSRWQTVKRVGKTGRFRGSYRIKLATLFAGKPVNAGRYRLTLSADGGSTRIAFKVIQPAARPRAGNWVATSLTGPVSGSSGGGTVKITSLSFAVGAGEATVGGFGFGYDWSGTPAPPTYNCSGSGVSFMTSGATSPITNDAFSSPSPTGAWSGPVSGFVTGSFDSATTAHGTANASAYIGGIGCAFSASPNTGTFSWTAAWQAR